MSEKNIYTVTPDIMNIDGNIIRRIPCERVKRMQETFTDNLTKFIGENGFHLDLVGTKYIKHSHSWRSGGCSVYTFQSHKATFQGQDTTHTYLSIIFDNKNITFHFRTVEKGNGYPLYWGKWTIPNDVLWGMDEQLLPSITDWKTKISEAIRALFMMKMGRVLRFYNYKGHIDPLNFRFMSMF